jgi:hypothetical protein
MHYYDMRQQVDVGASPCRTLAGFPWDTSLVRSCGFKRPAWYTWCRASRQNDAACYDDSPSAASWGPYRIDVLFRGNDDDGAIYRRSWDSSSWSSTTSLTGASSNGPAVVAPASKRLDVYARGGDNGVWYRRYDGSAWSAWATLGGTTYASPAASVRRGTSIVDVFMRGTDDAIWQRYRNGNTWSPAWVSIGAPPGGATSSPAAVSNANGRIEVFVRGADSAIWRRTWTGAWSPWTSVGGVATSAPAVTSRGTNKLDLFVRGADGQVNRTNNEGSGWAAWTALGGSTISAPAAVATSSTRVDIWARGADNVLQHKFWKASTGWSAWSTTWFAGPKP